nr:MAG TPA: hypothetical protein [Caudoviricetes sp.]
MILPTTQQDEEKEGVRRAFPALFGGNRSNAAKCGLSYWNLNNLATNVNANIAASQSYQMTEHSSNACRSPTPQDVEIRLLSGNRTDAGRVE